MNRGIYSIAKYFRFIPLDLLIYLTRQKTVLPFYHLVSDAEVVHVKNLYRVKSVKEFSKDLDFYLKHFEPADFTCLAENNRKKFLLTFDDGLSEFYHIIAPLLLQKGIPAICFLNTAFIDNKDLFYRYKASILIEELNKKNKPKNLQKDIEKWSKSKNLFQPDLAAVFLSVTYTRREYLDELAAIMEVDFTAYLQEKQPYLTSGQIRELTEKGFHFGAHSTDHPLYAELNTDEQIRQTRESMEELQARFSFPYRLFSFPFTDDGVTRSFFENIYTDIGGSRKMDMTFGCSGLKKDSFRHNWQRIPMEIENFTASDIIYGEYLYYMLKGVFNRNMIKRK